MEQAKQSKTLRHPRADGGLWCNLTGFMDSRLRGNDEKGKVHHAEFNHPCHAELVSASRHKPPQTLNQVQGDNNGKNGFTLVELAIALMVIGLLIGGVLKGQELIENARITATIRQINAYDTASLIFRNTYNALPGDIKRPNRIPNCTTDDAVCGIGGNGNGKIMYDNALSPRDIERYNFFPHLSKAGMIQGPKGGTQAQAEASSMWDISDESELFYPVAAIDTVQILMHGYTSYGGLSPHTHYYFLWQLTGKQAAALDEKMDDGDGTKGSVAVEDGADCLIGDWPDLKYDRVNGRCGMLVGAGF